MPSRARLSTVEFLPLPAGPDPLALFASRRADRLVGVGDEGHGDGTPSPAGWHAAGPENRLVQRVARRLLAAAEDDASLAEARRCSPVTLVGLPGSGKTLLATGVADHWARAHGDDAVLQMTLTDLRRRWDQASRDRDSHRLRRRLARARLLVIEDTHRAAPNPRFTAELVTLLDELAERGGLLLMTSGVAPPSVPAFDAALLSRLSAGLVLEVAAAEPATRAALLSRCLEAAGRRAEPAALRRLAEAVVGDTRELLALANQLCQLVPAGRTIAAPLVERVLERRHAAPGVELREIAAVVARRLQQRLRELKSGSRRAPVVHARGVAIYLARQLTPLSYEEIGRYFGGRDHTTIAHNHHRLERLVAADAELRARVATLRRELETTARPSA